MKHIYYKGFWESDVSASGIRYRKMPANYFFSGGKCDEAKYGKT